MHSISLGLVSHFKTVFAYSINNSNVLFIFNIAICHCRMPNRKDAATVQSENLKLLILLCKGNGNFFPFKAGFFFFNLLIVSNNSGGWK